MSDAVTDNLLRARCVLVHNQPFYGHMCMSMEWIESDMDWQPREEAKTMGVRILNDLKIQCLWYKPFVEKQTVAELVAIVQHEVEHLIRLHCLRGSLTRDPNIWNIACDQAVNGKRDHPKIGIVDSANKRVIPFKGDICWCPPNLSDTLSAPEHYDLLIKEFKQLQCTCPHHGEGQEGNQGAPGGSGNGNEEGKGKQGGKGQGKKGKDKGQGQGGCGDGEGDGECQHGQGSGGGGSSDCPIHGGRFGRMIDDHSTWSQSDANPDEARQMMHDMVRDAVEKSQGNVPGHISQILQELSRPIVRWRALLRQYLGQHVGSSRRTYSRANRRYDMFGMKGVSHHAAATVNVIIDTSGSVSEKELQQFFAEIDQIATRAKVMVLQWDHAFQGYARYRRGAWRNFKINGRGGTDMAAPIYWLRDNKCVADCQIMLTDGECNWATKQSFPLITCITTRDRGEPDWGHVVRLDVNQ